MLAPPAENEWSHLHIGTGELATATDWRFVAFLVADLGFPDCFASHLVVFVMKLAWKNGPHSTNFAENEWCHLCDSLDETAAKTD